MKSISKIFIILSIFCTSLPVVAADYYWVGGSGNWSDLPNHWRTSSGGTGTPSVVPGPADNVIFDINSGFTANSKTITLDIVANCRNITFLGSTISPTLYGYNESELNIYGSSIWQTGMAVKVYKMYYRHSGEEKTIKSNGVVVNSGDFGYVYFEEQTSTNLLDNLNISGILYLQAGTWNTNNYSVTTGEFALGLNIVAATINLGSSHIYLNRVGYSRFNVDSSNLIFNAGTSHIHFTEGSLSAENYGIVPYKGQVFHDVSFEKADGNGGLGGSPYRDGSVYYNKVEFFGDGTIFSNNHFKELKLSSTKSYVFPANYTQTIQTKFTANTAACDGWGNITSSSENGVQAKIAIFNTTETAVSGNTIKNIAVSGGTIAATNSQDAGNNSGLSFLPSITQNLYWVGGAGNWNDKNNWSQTTGGSGGYCVPGLNDNVFFDANSNFTLNSKRIIIDNNSYCNNITFQGSAVPPELYSLPNSVSKSLEIYGSSVWQSGMTVNLLRIFYRNSNLPKTITSNGVIIDASQTQEGQFGQHGRIYFEEKSSISFLDDFNTTGQIWHTVGTLNTNSHEVRMNEFQSKTSSISNPVVLNLGNSEIFCGYRFSTDYYGFTLNAGTSHIHLLKSIGILLAKSGHVFYDVSFMDPAGPGTFGVNQEGLVSANKVRFYGDGIILGNNKFTELQFEPSRKYEFAFDRTQNIISLFSSSTVICEGWITLKSNQSGSKATIAASESATISVSGVIIEDITASGGADFTALNSVDNGNNMGWDFAPSVVKNLYWIGGTGSWSDKQHWSQTSGGNGGYCIPGPKDNVFFDANSGFTSSSKTVTLNNFSYCRDIIFQGNNIPPVINASGNDASLNIYGSSVWQTEMKVNIAIIYYKNTGEPKTITSNNVSVANLRFEEKSSISLLDNLNALSEIHQSAGTWNTNGHDVKMHSYITINTSNQITLNLSSSSLTLDSYTSRFNTSQGPVALNAGTSHIHFTNSERPYYYFGLLPKENQVFYDVSFDGNSTNGGLGGSHTGTVYYNKVQFNSNATIFGNNEFKELVFAEGKSYILPPGRTQTVTEKFTLGGTPCFVTFINSSTLNTQAFLNIAGGPTTFNFGNLTGINAINPLYFGEQSSILNQNNTNITGDAYNPGSFEGLDADKLCHTINSNEPSTYIINTDAYFGNEKTKYKWFKLNDANYPANVAISMQKDLDIREYGYGTYRVQVSYENSSLIPCLAQDEILIVKQTEMPTAESIVCKSNNNTLADIKVLNMPDADVKWYASPSSNSALPLSSSITDEEIYYLTQTINNCESLRVPVNISLKKCQTEALVNPMIRTRVSR